MMISKKSVTGGVCATFAALTVFTALAVLARTSLNTPPRPPAVVDDGGASSIQGFFFGAASSCQPGDPPDPSILPYMFSFPGDPDPTKDVLPMTFPQVPRTEGYSSYILTLGGGATQWSDDTYTELSSHMSQVKANGWDGVCFDWEYLADGATITGVQGLLSAAKSAGLSVFLTSLAEGPAQSLGGVVDYTSFDWSLVDYWVPQIYGADGTMPAEWKDYVDFWAKSGGGTSVQNIIWTAPPLEKILWGVTATDETYSEVMTQAPGSGGYVGWCYDPY